MTRPLTEAQWQARVLDLARFHRWWVFHIGDSRTVTEAGWPDLVLLRERMILVELKSDTGRVSRAQTDCHERLLATGQTVFVWLPAMWDEVQKILAPYGRKHA